MNFKIKLNFDHGKKGQRKNSVNLELYAALMTFPEVEIKGATMPYTSVNGNIYSYLKDGSVALRLSEEDRKTFIKKFKSKLFETYGIIQKEYVTISPTLLKKKKT
jgi:hypothetical protein